MARQGHGIIEKKHRGGEVTQHHITHERGLVFRSDRDKPIEDEARLAYREAEKAKADGRLDAIFALTEDGLGVTDLEDIYESAFYDRDEGPIQTIFVKKGKTIFKALLGEDKKHAEELRQEHERKIKHIRKERGT